MALLFVLVDLFAAAFLLSDFVRYTFYLPATLLESGFDATSYVPMIINYLVFGLAGFLLGRWLEIRKERAMSTKKWGT